MIRSLSLAALAACLIAHPAQAQGTNATQGTNASRGAATQGTAAKAAVSDTLFVTAAADGGMAEVMLAELGVQKATDPELKKFSQAMVEEHTKMNAQLAALASSKGLALPKTVSAGHQFCAQSLAGLSGEEFDACYAKTQAVLHMDSLAKHEAEAERGQDSDIKALAAKGVPHIKMHLKTIKPIAMKYEEMEKQKKGEK